MRSEEEERAVEFLYRKLFFLGAAQIAAVDGIVNEILAADKRHLDALIAMDGMTTCE